MTINSLFPDFAALQAEGFAGVTFTKPAIMIAMTARTGSTHLCASLHAAGLPFEPTEIFNPRGVIQYEAKRRDAASFAAYLDSLASTPGDIFMFKVSWNDFAPFAPNARDIFPRLKVIYLDRRDIAAQAVSLVRAVTSNIWHRRSIQPRQNQKSSEDFDIDHAILIAARLEAEKQLWEEWFNTENITPMRLFYESFEKDISVALHQISDAFDLALKSDPGTSSRFEKLADETSSDWAIRLQLRLLLRP